MKRWTLSAPAQRAGRGGRPLTTTMPKRALGERDEPIGLAALLCDDDGCAPELFEEAKFKSENDCDEDGCVPKFDEPVSAVTGEAKKEQ